MKQVNRIAKLEEHSALGHRDTGLDRSLYTDDEWARMTAICETAEARLTGPEPLDGWGRPDLSYYTEAELWELRAIHETAEARTERAV